MKLKIYCLLFVLIISAGILATTLSGCSNSPGSGGGSSSSSSGTGTANGATTNIFTVGSTNFTVINITNVLGTKISGFIFDITNSVLVSNFVETNTLITNLWKNITNESITDTGTNVIGGGTNVMIFNFSFTNNYYFTNQSNTTNCTNYYYTNILFTVSQGQETITNWINPVGNIVIPATNNGYPIVCISNAFMWCTNLTGVTIPNSVADIGDYAFCNCTNLTSVIIPNSVTSIGSDAFSSTGLTSVTIPNSVTYIGDGAFGWTGLTSVTIPNSVTNIGDFTFRYCTKLTSVTIPNSVTNIGICAFELCSSLASVTIPNSVTSIGSGAFLNCTSLTSVTIPNSVTYIGDGAFLNCTSLTSITIQATIPPILVEHLYFYQTFNGCNASLLIHVPSGYVLTYQNATGWSTYSSIIGL